MIQRTIVSCKGFISSSQSNRDRDGAPMQEIFIDVRENELTLTEVLRKIEEIQSENPDLEIFLDGDEHAIRSRPRKGGRFRI